MRRCRRLVVGHRPGQREVTTVGRHPERQVPAAAGLFRQAICMSGFGNLVLAADEAARTAKELAAALMVRPVGEDLELVHSDRLIQVQQEISSSQPMDGPDDLARRFSGDSHMKWAPVVDGTVLPESPPSPRRSRSCGTASSGSCTRCWWPRSAAPHWYSARPSAGPASPPSRAPSCPTNGGRAHGQAPGNQEQPMVRQGSGTGPAAPAPGHGRGDDRGADHRGGRTCSAGYGCTRPTSSSSCWAP